MSGERTRSRAGRRQPATGNRLPAPPNANGVPADEGHDWRRRLVVAVATGGDLLIGAGAFRLSFASLTDLAGRAGLDSAEAWVWPLIIDGLIVVATVAVVALDGHGPKATRYPWILLIAAAAVSVAANAIHALVAPDVTVPAAIAGSVGAVPPLVLLGTTHLTVELIRWSATPIVGSQRRPRARPAAPVPGGRLAHARSALLTTGAREAVQLREHGWSNRQIARELRVHPSTVGRWLSVPVLGAPQAVAIRAGLPHSSTAVPDGRGNAIAKRSTDE